MVIHMKPTQRKDALRNIKKQFISFLSIVIVILLGVGIFLACRFGAHGVGMTANEFYRDAQYRDLEIRSTKGITNADVDAVKALSGVTDAEGIFAMDMVVQGPEANTVAHIVSQADRMDKVTVKEGRVPETDRECAIEYTLEDTLGAHVGDKVIITTKADSEDETRILKNKEFTVTGIIYHPEHFHDGDSIVANVMTTKDAFDPDALKADYTGMLIRTTAGETLDTFSEEYGHEIEEIFLSLSALGKERAKIHDDELLAEAQEKIDENEKKLDDGKAKLDDGTKEIEEKQGELAEAQAKIEAAQAKLDMGKEEIASSETELAEGKARLDSAKAELNEAAAKLEDGRVQLEAGKAELDASGAQLAAAKAELDAGRAELEANRQKLQEAYEKLNAGRIELDVGESELENNTATINLVLAFLWDSKWGSTPEIDSIKRLTENYTLTADQALDKLLDESGTKEEYREEAKQALEGNELWTNFIGGYDQIRVGEIEYAEGLAQYNDGLAQWKEGEARYEAGLTQYEEGVAKYNDGYTEYKVKEAEYNSAKSLYQSNVASYESSLRQYEDGLRKLNDAKAELESGENEFNENKQKFDDGKEKLAEGKTELSENTQKYEEGKAELEDAKEKLDAYEAGNWIIMDRSTNLSWHEISESMRSFLNIGNTFALLFILIAVLVAYATIGKIIDEQRNLVGTTRALGFTAKEVLYKYLLFGGLSAITGCVAGLLLSYFVLEKLIIDTIQKAYVCIHFERVFEIIPAVLSVVIGILVAAFASWIACKKLISKPAKELMSGEVPASFAKEKKKKAKNSAKQKSLYSGLIIRNIRSDIKRVLITIVSLAGCCMLLIIGFTLKSSLDGVISRQFEEIIAYDATVGFLPERSETAEAEIRDILTYEGCEYMSMYQFGTVTRVGALRETAQVVCADPDALMRFYNLTDTRKNTIMRIPDAGVVIYNRLAEVYSLEVGDHLSILDEKGNYHDVPVAGIYNCYAGRSLFMSDDYAKQIFGDGAVHDAFAVRLNGASPERIKAKLSEVKGFLDFRPSDEERAKYELIANAMNTVILVMIIMAGIMAAVVLLNLLRIQINQKKRELTVMRVNGFTVKETVMYILRENILTTLLGIGLGLVIGNIAAGVILRTIERVEIQMVREISWPSCLYSALITLGFAALMNYLSLRKIKKLKLSDVND